MFPYPSTSIFTFFFAISASYCYPKLACPGPISPTIILPVITVSRRKHLRRVDSTDLFTFDNLLECMDVLLISSIIPPAIWNQAMRYHTGQRLPFLYSTMPRSSAQHLS
jgi:hypothetical protein